MQNRLRILLSFFILAVTGIAYAQTTTVCQGETVIFDIAGDYYGNPVWEFSTDQQSWQEADVPATEPFELQPSMSGYYRLKLIDTDCDSTYYSAVQQIEVPALPEFSVHSTYIDLEMPSEIDPYFWVSAAEENFSDLVFHVNGNPISSAENMILLPNPGTSFSIYATATHTSGCPLVSETVGYEVFNSVAAINVTFDITGNFNPEDIMVESGNDVKEIEGELEFLMNYSEAFLNDMLFAYKHSFETDSQVVAMAMVKFGTTHVTMSNTNTATALVLSQPDVMFWTWEHLDDLVLSVESHNLYANLLTTVTNQIEAFGYLNFEDTELLSFVTTISFDILSEFDGSRGGGGSNFPLLTSNSEGTLDYDHTGLNVCYTARMYDGNTPVSDVILFGGSGQSAMSGIAAQGVLNILVAIPSLSSAIQHSQRSNNNLFSSDYLLQAPGIKQFVTRIVNGQGVDDGSLETNVAATMSVVNYSMHVLLSLGPTVLSYVKSVPACVTSCFSLIADTHDYYAALPSAPSMSEITQGLTSMFSSISGVFVDCGQLAAKAIFIKLAIAAGIASSIGTLAMMVWDMKTSEEEVRYENTKIGNRLAGVLKFESNKWFPFAGIPGSDTGFAPMFQLKESPAIARNAANELLLEELYQDYTLLNGISVYGIATNTESLRVNETTYQGNLFEGASVLPGENEIQWLLSFLSPMIDSAHLHIGFEFEGVLVQGVDGLDQEGFLKYAAYIDFPDLEIISGNWQTGIGEQYLLETCRVRLKTLGGHSVGNGYPIRFEVMVGNGLIQKPAPYTSEESGALDFETISFQNEEGYSWVNWKLGEEEEEQILKVSIIINNLEVTSAYFIAMMLDNQTCGSSFIDARDGQIYSVAQIGNQCWFAENLRYVGDIPQVIGNTNWAAISDSGNPTNQPAWCYYGDNPTNDAIYGKLYNWHAVNTGTLCPQGWHIPTDADWTALITYLDPNGSNITNVAGGKMKSTTGWNPPNTDATNESGFSGLPGGYRYGGGSFNSVGEEGLWWSSTENDTYYASIYGLFYGNGAAESGATYKTLGFSCRCLRD